MEPMVPFYSALITTEQHFQCKRLSTGGRDGTQSLSGSQEHKAGCSVCGPGVPWGWRHSVYGSKVQSSYSYECHGVQELGTWCLQVQGHRGSWGLGLWYTDVLGDRMAVCTVHIGNEGSAESGGPGHQGAQRLGTWYVRLPRWLGTWCGWVPGHPKAGTWSVLIWVYWLWVHIADGGPVGNMVYTTYMGSPGCGHVAYVCQRTVDRCCVSTFVI